ncbi:MAG: nicotinamide mononucleotide transporter [Candidatus Neomarinimicrobiota bacterium]|nr:nicotinamide mononucleotide transporter [Candidatus Neomarinimicrobiota bacterium]MEC9437019.1 nicotinamide mononucleotide transporter [Candidatus Neomarinimicrobiota bacterium]MEC9475330.1 nicotinamide mononucleotide transporter [Candidatus Neomarinimicrobiota bacterium]MED5433648.1 nicotinamide mononucleotide transporter [Candidatus Neomarinimicrobiota bacterium]MEE3303216.1 nicotinamide mononucleotide transporter [Candidatus Neomarinimicrobiota bacterium]
MSVKSEIWKIIGWIGASLVVFGYYLNANGLTISWIIWIAGNLMVGMYSLTKKAYSTAVMSFIITLMNIYGYYSWIK